MTYEEFWGKIEITEEEKEKSVHYLKYRGVEEHNHVRQYLESVTGRRASYSEIATAFRYDKRIRRVLYKYIGLFEESIRAYISNKYSSNIEGINLTVSTKQYIAEYKKLFVALSELTFRRLITQVKNLVTVDLIEMFGSYEDDKVLFDDLEAVVELRNAVSHNRFLLDNKRLKKCSVGDKNNSLWANIVNLWNFLPEPFQTQFSKEINECAKQGHGIDFETQTDWNLIGEVVVKLS